MFGSKAKKKNKEYARLVAACKEGNVADVETFLAKGRAEVNRFALLLCPLSHTSTLFASLTHTHSLCLYHISPHSRTD